MTTQSIYLCLVSVQRMQNILPLFQQGAGYDRVVMIASGTPTGGIAPRFREIATSMQEAMQDQQRWVWELHPDPVDPMDPSSTAEACRKIIQRAGESARITINVTGGTKPMSIGAYIAAMEAQGALYVDTEAERIYTHLPSNRGGGVNAEPFDLRCIPVALHLEIHGKKLKTDKTGEKLSPTIDHWLSLFSNSQNLGQTIRDVHELMTDKPGLVLDEDNSYHIQLPHKNLDAAFTQQLVDLGLAREMNGDLVIYNNAQRFLNGRWLEAYVWDKLDQTGQCMDICKNLEVIGIANELDVACTVHGKLGVVECKTGSLKGKEGQNVLNKLMAIKDGLGGIFAKSFLVITNSEKESTEEFKKRANEYGATIIFRDQLENAGNIIIDKLSSRRRTG